MDPSNTDSDNRDDDPLRQLEAWSRKVNRKVRREDAGKRFWARLTWPVRVIGRRPGVAVIVLLVVAAGGGVVWLTRGSLLDWSGAYSGQPYPTQSHPAGPFATSSASADPAGPFAHTPAAHWAEGAAGIAMPAPEAVDGFTAAQVADDLATVKKALIATRLDHRMLIDHDLSELLSLVAPASRARLTEKFRGDNLFVVTVIDESAHLDSLAPRVSGRSSFSSTKDTSGRKYLDVVTNYVWAYGFDNDEVVVIHDEIHWRFYREGDVREAELGLTLGAYEGYYANIDCTTGAHHRLAPPDLDIVAGAVENGENPDSIYSPDHALAVPNTCPSSTPAPVVAA